MMKYFCNLLASDNSIKKGLVLFLGPLFLVISLSLAGPSFLWVSVFLGLLLIWKLPKIGIYLSLSFVVLLAIFLPSKHPIWQAGLEITIALGLVITHYSFSLFHHLMDNLEKRSEENEKQLLILQDEVKSKTELFQKEKEETLLNTSHLQKAKMELEQKLSMAFVFTDTLQTKIDKSDETDQEIEKLRSSYAILKEEKESLKDAEAIKKNNLELLQKLNQTRVEKFQVHLINEALARVIQKETVKSNSKEEEIQQLKEANISLQKEILHLAGDLSHAKAEQVSHTQYLSETNSLKKEVQMLRDKIDEKNLLLEMSDKGLVEARNAEHSYIELRKQFEEKSKLLHQTRGELFVMETHFLALQKEKENAQLDSFDSSFVTYLNDLQHLEDEVQELRQLITQLLIQEKPKTTRKKASSKDQLPLV